MSSLRGKKGIFVYLSILRSKNSVGDPFLTSAIQNEERQIFYGTMRNQSQFDAITSIWHICLGWAY